MSRLPSIEAYTMAGGLGTFRVLARAAGLNGHFLVNDPPLWGPPAASYIDGL